MAGKARFNKRSIDKKLIGRADKTINQMRPKFDRAKNNAFNKWLRNDFMQHEVTKEIKAGPRAENTSGILGGYGNLFSFIGFSEGEDPIKPVVEYLRREIRGGVKIRHRRGSKEWLVTFKIPSLDGVGSASPLPWAAGRSWTVGIERGISGLGKYLYSERSGLYGSASGTGLQVKNKLLGSLRNQSRMRPTQYMSALLNLLASEIKEELNKETKRGR